MDYEFDINNFKDVMIVDAKGRLQYFNIGSMEFFDLKPEEILGKTMPELYENLDADTSTFEIAVHEKRETLRAEQILRTQGGKAVRQTSDTLLIRDGEDVLGAVEFTHNYDVERDVLGISAEKPRERLAEKEIVSIDDVIGESPAMQRLKRKAAKVADSSIPILFSGETGTGKERLARAIHYAGKRRKESFVYLNCNSIPEELLEGILFGTSKGSFTDAVERDGLFRMADRGTLFLDEIDTMPLEVQGKLLKAIEDGRVRPIGGKEEYVFDIRIIACCNCSLNEIMNSKHLRQDFYFRLAVLQFEMPPLRERGEDVIRIAEYYIKQYNETSEKKLKGFSDEAAAYLNEYGWKGNVRELRNLIERMYFDNLQEDVISLKTVKEKLHEKREDIYESENDDYEKYINSGLDFREYIAQTEEKIIADTIERSGGNIAEAARLLNVSAKTLRNRKKEEKIFT